MNKISTGEDATLGTYRKIACALFGEDSGATKYLDEKINTSPNKENEEVIADETQVLYLLYTLSVKS